MAQNQWTLGSSWQIGAENITSNSASSTLSFHASAKDIYMVAGNADNQPATVGVSLPASDSGQFGSDAPGGFVTVNGSKLYHIVSLQKFGDTTVTLTVPAGVSLYTFTFGS